MTHKLHWKSVDFFCDLAEMFRLILQVRGSRHFSKTSIWRNINKENKTPVESNPSSKKPQVDESKFPEQAVKLDLIPSSLDKLILVMSGKYKSKAEIPERINFGTLDNAKSIVRIRGSNILIVLALLTCFGYAWHGKQQSKAGDSIVKRQMKIDQEILSRK